MNGKLKFEGEYLYDKIRKGKEYNANGQLIFEGEYKDGKKFNGKGYKYPLVSSNDSLKLSYKEGKYFSKINNKEGKLLFEGIVLPENSSEKYIEGKIYEYDLNGDIIFEGQIINGEKKNGKEVRYVS